MHFTAPRHGRQIVHGALLDSMDETFDSTWIPNSMLGLGTAGPFVWPNRCLLLSPAAATYARDHGSVQYVGSQNKMSASQRWQKGHEPWTCLYEDILSRNQSKKGLFVLSLFGEGGDAVSGIGHVASKGLKARFLFVDPREHMRAITRATGLRPECKRTKKCDFMPHAGL